MCLRFDVFKLVGVWIVLAVMPAQMRAGEPLGLVLSGGGARGAYEIGVWKAICELKIDQQIEVFSGTSVGAINAALFGTVRDPVQCEEIWKDSIRSAFVCNTNKVKNVLQETVDELDRRVDDEVHGRGRPSRTVTESELWGAVLATIASAVSKSADAVSNSTTGTGRTVGVCDSHKLRSVLSKGLPGDLFPKNPYVYVTALNKVSHQKKVFRLNGLSKDMVVDRLMASTAIPVVFDSVVIDGENYIDGGYEIMGGDNVPTTPIISFHQNIKTLIVVYLKSESRLKRLNLQTCRNVRLLEIFPSEDIGGMTSLFNTTKSKTEELIDLGYRDAIKGLKKLTSGGR